MSAVTKYPTDNGSPVISARSGYGIAGDDTTDDTTALNNFLKDCVSKQAIAYLPDRYKISGTLQCGGNTGGQVRILGTVGHSWIRSTSTTADVLHIGDGTNTTDAQLNGWIDGLRLYGANTTPAAVPQNGQVALLLNKMSLFRVQNVITAYTDIGIDMHNNCFGSSFWNCKTGFGGTHNVGLNLSTSPGTGTGNQIFSYNCWHEGTVAAVHMSPDGDGYAFYGGQMTATRDIATRHDGYGAVIIGKDYLTGTTGTVGSITLYDVDFEGVGSWFLRAFGESSLIAQGCLFLANGAQPAIGILSHDTNVGQSQYFFRNCTVSGDFSNATPMALDSSDGSLYILQEDGWRIAGSDPTFNSVSLSDFPGLLATSGLSDRGLAFIRRSYMTQMILGGGRLRFNGTTFEKSTDGGSTWSAV